MTKDMEEILDLLTKQVTVGLTDEEAARLNRLEEAADSSMDSHKHELELTAAAISMMGLDASEPMPAHLESKILADARKYFAEKGSAREASEEENVLTRPRRPVEEEAEPRGSFWNWFPWAVTAAACALLAFNVWTTRIAPDMAQDTPKPTPTPEIEKRPNMAELREKLLAAAPDLVRAEWGEGNVKEAEGISGDVVWSDARQEGYMRFRGLPANDPLNETYQLWIFDETQDEKTPIDGGIFDIGTEGEVIIPINAKLKAKNPALFAVTVEKPGGVVVSTRDKVAALAKVETPSDPSA